MHNVNDIKKQISLVRNHYDNHLNNKYIKNLYRKIELPHMVSQEIKHLLESEVVYIDSKGALIDLYDGIKGVIFLLREIRVQILPSLKAYSNPELTNFSSHEKILYQMAISNYPQNIKIFTNDLHQLYEMILEFDKNQFNDDPAYKKISEFGEIEHFFRSET